MKMPCVYYKYNYYLYHNILIIDSPSTTLNELKKLILAKEGLNGLESGLQVINEHTHEGMMTTDTLTKLIVFIVQTN